MRRSCWRPSGRASSASSSGRLVSVRELVVALHIGDEATELFEDELRTGRIDDLREELRAVERAEQRLAAGTYGLSVESGVPIPDDRFRTRD